MTGGRPIWPPSRRCFRFSRSRATWLARPMRRCTPAGKPGTRQSPQGTPLAPRTVRMAPNPACPVKAWPGCNSDARQLEPTSGPVRGWFGYECAATAHAARAVFANGSEDLPLSTALQTTRGTTRWPSLMLPRPESMSRSGYFRSSLMRQFCPLQVAMTSAIRWYLTTSGAHMGPTPILTQSASVKSPRRLQSIAGSWARS